MLSSLCLVSAADLESSADAASSTGFFGNLFGAKKMHSQKMHENKMHVGMHQNRMHASMHANRAHTSRDLDKAIREADARKADGRTLQRRDSFKALETYRGPEGMADVQTPGASSQKMLQELRDAKKYTNLLEQENQDLQRENQDLRALVGRLDSQNEELTNKLLDALEYVGR